jgi:hypothetical protein
MYTVIVANVGKIGEYASRKLAKDAYKSYVELSTSGYGRVAGESVYLFENDEIIEEHMGTRYQEGNE